MKANADVRVAIDGKLVDSPSISVFDRGFLYGDSVFETTRTYEGVPFRLLEHIERLAWSAAKLGFELPLAAPDIAGEIEGLVVIARERDPGVDLVVRQMVTRGEGPLGLDPTGSRDPRRVVFIHPLHRLPTSIYTDGVSVVSVSTFRPSDAARGAKVGNYLESILALKEARASGAHEALILSYDGCLVEGTTSNVFALCGGRLLTPPVTETLLPGITRALVIAAAKSLSLEVVERRMDPQDLAGADEVFLTSTIREVVPVVTSDGFAIGTGKPGPLTRTIHSVFRKREGLPGPQPWE